MKKPVFHLLHQAAFPGVHRGDLSFYSRESTSLVVGDIGRKFFYVAKPNRQIEIAMAYSDIVSELPTQIVQNSTSEINSNHVRYLDTEGEIRFAKVYPLFNFVQMAVHLPKQNSRYPWTAIWIKDWTEEKGYLVSAQMLDFLGISMEKAKLLLAGDGILTREKLEGLFGPLFFGANP
ncbi:MAG: hypothetical protein IPJ71_00305 [Bdellovibrionales bacterium]|nr:hypothetical protein [Bdellovibrionales bacterium]